MILAIDFDGTCVTHEYPQVGKEIGAASVLKALTEEGHRLVLFTMRSDGQESNSTGLTDAVNWFKKHDIPLWGIQRNPEQDEWTGSPKAYAHIYIDDAALGCPLVTPEGGRPYVDWKEVCKVLIQRGLLPNPINSVACPCCGAPSR